MSAEKWKEDLKGLLQNRPVDKSRNDEAAELQSKVKKFFSGKVQPVFKKLKKELERYGREVHVSIGESSGAIEVNNQGQLELDYKVKVRGEFPYPETLYKDASGSRIWGEGAFREGPGKYSIADLPEDVILEDFLREYKSRLWSLSK
jgi:hypothetical protein